ncbi:RNA polymerase II transcriptional coactivator KELP-like [Macadamia integrifolia]|uniref:RNA polymerase II transcriptional coactivator KELP-like n=1 Tax=Macadamia integrifolia TaxID=60698 RepID=UPI001C50225B|nr:RNA polymerase II transcriptional coactivator KELP-like [Macadamia integrifolia]
MEPATQREVEETVLEILRNTDMNEMTEFKVRTMAAEKLGVDLSGPEPKRFVRNVVESFLLSKEQQEQQVTGAVVDEEKKEIEEEEEDGEGGEEEKKKSAIAAKEYDDDGDLIICRLSNKRRVTIQDFRGKTLVSIREYYERDGKQLPSSKGISLTAEQWSAFSKAVPAIEEAIEKMESRLR